MSDSLNDDDDIIQQPVTENVEQSPEATDPLVPSEAPVDLIDSDGEDGDIVQSFEGSEEDDDQARDTSEVAYPEDKIDFRGERLEALIAVFRKEESLIGPTELDSRVRTVGSWQNLVFRAMVEPNYEEMRLQESLGDLDPAERSELSTRLKRDGKTILRTAPIVQKLEKGQTKTFTGDDAVAAFAFQKGSGGGYRVALYNSGLTVDILTPTGTDVQTLLTNCLMMDNQLGAGSGAHYFAYNDLMIKTQILNFLQPLIVNSSYIDWRKRHKLWAMIKLPDLGPLVATLAALCYPKGFDGFLTKCTNPGIGEPPIPCRHTESIKANIFEMIVTRWPVLSESAINFMIEARTGLAKHTSAQIADYQESLGLEKERLTFGDITFVMRIPTLTEHAEAGQKFLADIINEIEGDNTDGRYEQLGVRYIRTFVPWVGSVEKRDEDDDNVMITSEPKVIVRLLEQLYHGDNDDKILDRLRQYVNKTQLTYVGYPATECPVCHYTADTPSGMLTFDPFNAFFTLAFQYSARGTSVTNKA